jgi:hypothetical protein
MAAPPDFSELAKRYVDLWQSHLMAIAGDPALAESVARVFTGAPAPHWPAPFGNGAERRATPPAGAAAAAAAPPQRDRALGELTRRLAALEERIAALEARSRRSGKRVAKKPRRRRV